MLFEYMQLIALAFVIGLTISIQERDRTKNERK